MDSPPPPFRASSLDCEHDALPAVFDDIPDGPLSDIMGFVFELVLEKDKEGAKERLDLFFS